ncbi:MAG: hypothetical protein EVB10_02285 [Verrucomicrobiaceae bacterium]|nr:MAG: hypothetical protein EVB10_02285 [Verrucomicrobiaceae bacterium]
MNSPNGRIKVSAPFKLNPHSGNDEHIKESKVRSTLKGLSWKIIVIVYVKTAEFESALEIGSINFFLP